MAIKKQLQTIKDNWLIAVIVLVLFMFLSGGMNMFGSMSRSLGSANFAMQEMAMDSYSGGYAKSNSYYESDFAPEVEERLITKTTSMSTEVKRGMFDDAETKLNSIIKSSDSYLLNQNSRKNGVGLAAYKSGSYTIKVDSEKYDAVIAQLKEIGDVKSFSENARDITASYTNTEVEIEVEKARLKRYEEMYKEAEIIEDKITLNDRIFNQERTIKYMEDRLKNLGNKVDYSTVQLSISEERSSYANIVLVKFADLIKGMVSSFNSLLRIIFSLIPWAIAVWIITAVVKLVKKKK